MDTGNKRLFITWVHSQTPLYWIPLGTNNFVPYSEVFPTQVLRNWAAEHDMATAYSYCMRRERPSRGYSTLSNNTSLMSSC